MARHNNPRAVTDSLLLNLDFRNSKQFTSNLGTNIVQDYVYNASTWGTFYTIRTTGIDAPDGSNTAVRMTSIVRTGTYTLTTNVATITIPNHGLGNGSNNYFDFTSGTGVDGFYTVTVVDANTFTIPVTAANGSGNVTLYVRTGLRVYHNAVTPNGTDTYTISFWVRKVSGTTLLPGQLILTDWRDSTQKNYGGELIDNTWVYVTYTFVPTATSKEFVDILSDTFGDYVLDYWGLKVENQTANNTPLPLKDTIGNYTFNVYRPQYSILSSTDITFTRTASAPKWGGLAFTTTTGSLTSQSFMYGDHTWEIWFKINDVATGNYDATEGWSALSIYRGYHAGFMYANNRVAYYMWDSVGPTGIEACNWTLSTSGAQVNQGSWYQIVVTRSGNVFTPYLNGVAAGTGSTRAYTAYVGVTNDLCLGASTNAAAGASSYLYYGKNTISNMKMYNRALSATEISQNFNALRGRFGI